MNQKIQELNERTNQGSGYKTIIWAIDYFGYIGYFEVYKFILYLSESSSFHKKLSSYMNDDTEKAVPSLIW